MLEVFRELGLDRNLHFVDASDDVPAALAGVIEPEQKRQIIGNTFIEVFEREARRLGIEGHLLGQGTIYPDTIETGGTKRADTIKTHHNRVPVIEEMIEQGRVVEPLAELYKVEVRELGEQLGIPRDLVWRHPFPGPGPRRAAALLDRRRRPRGLRPRSSRRWREVAARYGVDGAGAAHPVGRREGRPAVLRAPGARRAATRRGRRLLEVAGEPVQGRAGHQPLHLEPRRRARRRGAARWPPTVTRERLDLLREADALVMDGLRRHGLYDAIWQCPTVLVPLEVDGRGREFVIVRPIHSERAMTATPAHAARGAARRTARQILALPGVSGLALDVTTKPPGTIEWE